MATGATFTTTTQSRSNAAKGLGWTVLPTVAGAVTTAVAASRWAMARRALARSERALQAERTDELTGLWTRRTWKAITQAQVLNPEQQLLWVGMVDIDDLKPINDCLGHQAGDSVLKAIAYRLTTALPTPICVGRIGGDEFGVLVTNPPAGWSQQLANELAQPVSKLPVRASLGAVPVPPAGADLATLLSRADDRMYQAKFAHRGGGRLADPEPEPAAPRLRAVAGPHASQHTALAPIRG